MKHLILAAVAAIALPTTALANEAWLVLSYGIAGGTSIGDSNSMSLISIPMKSLEGCEKEGQKWQLSKPKFRKGIREYKCLENR